VESSAVDREAAVVGADSALPMSLVCWLVFLFLKIVMYTKFYMSSVLVSAVCNLQIDLKYSSPFRHAFSLREATRHVPKKFLLLLHSEHSYGTTRDSDEEDAEPEDGERLDHPYSAPQVCSSMFCLTYCYEKEMFFNVDELMY
jgi:hypothetical protein